METRRFIVVMCLVAHFVCGEGVGDVAVAKKTYRAGLPHVPGIMYRNLDGTPGGFPCEVLAAAARDEGISLEWVDGTWAELLKKLKAGEIDVLPGTQFSRERAQYLDFLSEPLFNMWSEMYIRKGESFSGLDDLRNRRIGLVAEDNNAKGFQTFIRGFEIPFHPVEFASHRAAIKALARKEVYAIVGPQVALLGELAHDLTSTGLVFNPTELSIAFPKGKAVALRKALDKRIAEYKANPSSVFYKHYRALREPMFQRETRVIPPWLIATVMVLLVLLFLVVLFLALLRYQVRRALREVNRSQRALRERENDLCTTLDSIGEGVIVTTCSGEIVRINPVAAELVGWEATEAVGQNVADVLRIIDPGTRERLDKLVPRALAGKKPVQLIDRAILISRDGTEHWISDSASPIFKDSGNPFGVVIVFRDVTDEIHKEEQLLHSRKMEAVGLLAGGVAHDFNNMLMGIMGFAELLAGSVEDEDQKEYCGEIMTSAHRAAKLTRQLLSFARKEHIVPRAVDVHAVIRDSIRILKRSVDKSIEIQTDLQASEPVVLGDASQLQNTFINLGINSRDAMPNGGVFAIRSEEVTLGASQAQTLGDGLLAGDYLRISVWDDGEGMDEKTRQHVFEPFFTTKEVGHGTGLGLSAVYGMIESHGGAVTLKSAPGEGACFEIYLPRADVDLDETRVGDTLPMFHTEGTILLIEDEPAVQKVCEAILMRMGYKVLVAQDGLTGLEMYESYASEIKGVLLDVIMPGINGWKVFQELRKINSAVKILIASGHADSELKTKFKDAGANAFISKPYSRDTLANALMEVLE
ncbi:MAG: transporter substrate-binding domain-containing protein [Phycisphaerales bacterium]|jgi:PAS domain S-box-containing protein|nr:transporter substrate-binding domain-containing protein [Phycisphaerales bacterium]